MKRRIVEIISEDPVNICKGFSDLLAKNKQFQGFDQTHYDKRARVGLEVAALYAKEVRDNENFLDTPLMAATAADDIGTLSGVLVTLKSMDLFKYNFPVLNRLFTDFSGEPGVFGQTANTRVVVTPSVQEYDNTLGDDGRPKGWKTASPAKTIDVPITLSKHVGVPIVFSSQDLASTFRRLFEEQTKAQVYALTKYFVDMIYSLFTPANYSAYAAKGAKVPIQYPTFACAAAEFARSKLLEIETAFDVNEVPFDERFLLLNPTYYAKLAADPSIVTVFAAIQSPEIITKSVLPMIAGFQPFKAPNLPNTNNLVGMALHRAGAVIKARVPGDLQTVFGGKAGYGILNTIVDPETQLSFMLVQYAQPTQAYAEQRLSVMLGAAKGDTRGGLCITSG